MPHRPRTERDGERRAAARRAADSAIDLALAQIGTAFDAAAAINGFKLRVEQALRRGPRHPAVRARFAARAAQLPGCDLDAAVVIVERWWRTERKAFQIACAFGRGSRLSVEVLRELRLVLRLMRFKRMHAAFGAIAAALGDQTIAEAAE